VSTTSPSPKPTRLGRPGARTTRSKERLKAFHEEVALGRATDLRLLARLWPFVRPHAFLLVVSLSTLVVLCALRVAVPLLMGHVVAEAVGGDAHATMARIPILAGVMFLVQLLSFAQVYSMQIVGARAMADLRLHVFRFMQRLELRYYDRTPVGRLVTRATNDVDALGELFASGVLNAMGDFLMLAGIVVMMLSLNWRLSLIAFAALPIVGTIVNFVRRRSREAYREIRTKTARLNAFLNEQVSGIAVVQAFGREDAMAEDFDVVNFSYREANKNAIYYEALLDASIEMVATVCIASMLWWSGLHRLGVYAVTFALVVTFTQYIRQFFEPVSLLSQRYTMLQSAMAGAERIFQLLDEVELEKDIATSECSPAGPPDEALALCDVTFGYKRDVPVLRDVSVVAKRGERIALVGATGSGKTTIASLFLRLYEVTHGVARVLGQDVRAYSRNELRNLFSVVPQDVFLFAGTLLSNVAMSDPSPDRARAAAAIERIGALELFARRGGAHALGALESAPDAWLDVRVDERGANFSAGERQLIAFARAIYKDAPVLVLDEATASVDSDTEARLQKAVEAVMANRTSLIIAHRLSTIRAVDRIVVLHKGRGVETGSHDELLALGGVYARLYQLQFAKAAESAAE
jgi:ATP-binding cassette subfamily B protein